MALLTRDAGSGQLGWDGEITMHTRDAQAVSSVSCSWRVLTLLGTTIHLGLHAKATRVPIAI
jgi:hypothetical protein